MTTGSSWRAFALDIRWGCGHSIGLVVIALIFFAAGQTVDLDAVGGYLNYAVGFFMTALGIWAAVHVREKYQTQLKEGVRSSTGATPTNLVELMPLSQRRVSGAADSAMPMTSPRTSSVQEQNMEAASPSSPFHLQIKEDGASSAADATGTALDLMSEYELRKPCDTKASIFIMGVFAALYGEVTGCLGGNSLVMEFRIGIFSAFLSFIVGVAWIRLQASGQMDASDARMFTIVVGFIVLGALFATIAYHWKQHNNKRPRGLLNNMQRKSSKQRSFGEDRELLALQVSYDDIQDLRLFGSRAFSVVWLVRYRDSQLLASKRIQEDVDITEHTQTFVEKVKLASKLEHPNIVAFIGAAWSSEFDMQALFEFIENGDLRSIRSAPSLSRYWTRIKV
ncbi:hypothetical protein PHYSODRAFT_343070 [Phytophthora sojae]|uniref:Protein kinase domain-containing protein n=1 Tax=Phytophthora sojae (strain P6497) TaxID=1094619 RepID=G5AII8_PHYSP|nr:hypothetical protein PHYSODRAFT_343070 [Phytophthora sojae]EGZ04689.1 hypothetical protein PHYSODRAFT_343070 [Phytophthora sojae]|eukprot:XP_009539889.1 hypothetical protein PHYSODRAFT_343070 [Phytophthora sojae]